MKNEITTRVFHKETGEALDIYTVDAKEILRNPNSVYQRYKPGSVEAERTPDEDVINYPDDMPTEAEFGDMGIKDLKELARIRFNVEISYRKKADAVEAVKGMFAAEAAAVE
jgi:hypothetical protein